MIFGPSNYPATTYSRGEVLLEVQDVSLQLGGHQILRNCNVTVENLSRTNGQTTGQTIAFLGPSGLGKTQFLRILAALQEPTTGRVLITKDRIPVRPGLVGMVAQNHPLFRNRTVLGNLMLAAEQAGSLNARDLAIGMLKRFDMERCADLYPSQLSGGQSQRAAIAQQLLCSEHFLLMDEPFASLDPVMAATACQLISEVAGAHDLNTVILVTHDIRAALSVADTLWIMGRDHDANGKIIPGARIVERYDLIDRGLAWQPNIADLPQFASTEKEILAKFKTL